MIAANGTIINDDIPRPKCDGVPFFNFKSFLLTSCWCVNLHGCHSRKFSNYFLNFLNFSKLFQNIFIVEFKIDFFAVLSAAQLHFSFVLIDVSIRVLTIVLVTGRLSMSILKVRHKGGHFLSYDFRIYQNMTSLSYYYSCGWIQRLAKKQRINWFLNYDSKQLIKKVFLNSQFFKKVDFCFFDLNQLLGKVFLDLLIQNNLEMKTFLGSLFETETGKMIQVFRIKCFFA